VQKLQEDDNRVVLHFANWLSPIKLAVFPLVNKLDEYARKIFDDLINKINGKIIYDTSGSIGKRYRRQDAIGTPFCLTIDYDTPNTNIVTIRNRDDMSQIKLELKDVANYINEHIKPINE
jgi:glycyl-tRNA synthetase